MNAEAGSGTADIPSESTVAKKYEFPRFDASAAVMKVDVISKYHGVYSHVCGSVNSFFLTS